MDCVASSNVSVPCTTNPATDPSIELKIQLPDKSYVFAVEVELPDNLELASLFFKADESAYASASDRGFTVKAKDPSARIISSASWTTVRTPPSDRIVRMYLPVVDDETVSVLQHTRFVRISLKGNFRQLWLRRVAVLTRKVT